MQGRIAFVTRLLAIIPCCCFLAGCRFLESQERPETDGKAYEDPVLSRLLCPDLPVVEARLSANARRYRVYEARLRDDPPAHYVDRYLKLIGERGVLFRPFGTSPHAFPPRVYGYTVLEILPGPKKPFTLLYATYSTRDDRWLDRHRFTSAPRPVMLAGRSLTVRIGREDRAFGPFVVVPDQDVERLPELPFPRYPGAALKSVPPLNDSQLLDGGDVVRSYVAVGTTIGSVVRHYSAALRPLGIRGESDASFLWTGPARHGIASISIHASPVDFVTGEGISGSDLRRLFPQLLEGFPEQVVEYWVSVEFESASARMTYLPRADRTRYETLTRAKGQR